MLFLHFLIKLVMWFLFSVLHFFMAVLGLCCYAWAFSRGRWGLLCMVVHKLLIALASHCRAGALGLQASVVGARGLGWLPRSV